MTNFINRLLIIFHYGYFFIYPFLLFRRFNWSDSGYDNPYDLLSDREIIIFLIPTIFLFSFIKYCLWGKMIIFPWSNVKNYLNAKHRNYLHFFFDLFHFIFVYIALTIFLIIFFDLRKSYFSNIIFFSAISVSFFYLGPILKFLFLKTWVLDPFKIKNSKDVDFENQGLFIVIYVILIFLMVDLSPFEVLEKFKNFLSYLLSRMFSTIF